MHDFSILYSPYAVTLLSIGVPLLIVAAVWSGFIKGVALWYAARGGQRNWFIALLIVNSLGILEIIYLIWFRPISKAPAQVSSSAQV